MQCVTTNSIDGKIVLSYRGIVAAEVIFGANFVRDLLASVTDVIGGRSHIYEREFENARKMATEILEKKAKALDADAIIGMRFGYQVLGEKNGMMMVSAYGTAVLLTKTEGERNRDEVSAAEEVSELYVMIGLIEKGPFSIAQIRELLASGRIDGSAIVRIEGRADQMMVANFLELSPHGK